MGRVGRFGGVLISEPGVGIRCRWGGQVDCVRPPLTLQAIKRCVELDQR